ncbi:hypothetical protein BH24ACT22_BH24ACT22_15470 [soil metagenome]
MRKVSSLLAQALNDSIGEFDVVLCHAVLEWLANPGDTLRHLTKFLKPDGHLSLMFYNRNARLIKQIVRGNFMLELDEKDGIQSLRGSRANPLEDGLVQSWLEELGLEVRSKAGIRIFHDHTESGCRL